ncbi:MAG: hypothetical protein R3C03_04355 [Pirellulaceae bacterium]
MTQTEINQAVAETLGEDIYEINRLGFTLLDPRIPFFDPECDTQDAQVIDWDASAGESAVKPFRSIAA